MTTTRVLYVQAPGHARAGLEARLPGVSCRVTMAADVAHALRLLADLAFDICLVDLAGGCGAITAVRLVRARHPALPMAGVIDPASPAVATEAIHAGLTDLLAWPLDGLELAALLADVHDRAPAGPRSVAPGGLVAFSPAMRDVLRQVHDVAATSQCVSVVGAHGTGKSLVARALHRASPEADGPFVSVDCAERAPTEIEITLFGPAVSGDLTGLEAAGEVVAEGSAVARARGGTLVIEHLDRATARVQLRLASMLRDREILVGRSGRPVGLNVRVVATLAAWTVTNDEAGALRPELAARFSVRVDLPPLRRRRQDVPMLAVRCLEQRATPGGRPLRFSRAALEVLAALPWPGNVPELERVVDAVLTDTRRPVVQIEDVLRHVTLGEVPKVATGHGLRAAREQFERECIEAALARHQGRVGEAARALGIQRTNLYRKARQLGISRALLASYR